MADEEPVEDAGVDDDDDDDGPSGPWQGEGEIWYINTDLDVQADPEIDLAPLVDALESRGVHALTPLEYRRGDHGWYVVFETDDDFREPDPNVARMLDAIESLDPASLDLWRACTLRELNIGYDCGDRPWAFNNGLSNDLLRRAAAAGTSLRITLYPQRPPVTSNAPVPSKVDEPGNSGTGSAEPSPQ